MLKKLLKIRKIKLKNGKLKQVCLFDIPLFEYGKENDKTFYRCSAKKTKNQIVFYFKVNNMNNQTISLFRYWLDVWEKSDCYCFILCDNSKIINKLISDFSFPTSSFAFIKSKRSKFKKFVKSLS